MQALKDYPVIFKQTVAWGDMDAFAHVNNVQYYRYMESARIAYLQHLNIFEKEIYTVIASSNCQYLRPVLYPDVLHIGVRVEELRHSAIRMSYTLYSEQQQTNVAQGEAVLVCLNKTSHQKTNLPDDIRQKIIALEQQVGHVL
ncbi:MAG: acyl-CoA thioesterase [Acinetobacter sp.]|nr:MAG: acyl-CoA thioesterase [Acinetobacter sp.]